jgi:hypothetical protein
MHPCKHRPISLSNKNIALAKGRFFLSRWESESPKSINGEAFIWTQCLGGREQLFLDWLGPHLEKKNDRAARYSLLPCVKELLEESKEVATPMSGSNKWGLVGITPHGKSFWVIIGLKPTGEYFLNTCYRKF